MYLCIVSYPGVWNAYSALSAAYKHGIPTHIKIETICLSVDACDSLASHLKHRTPHPNRSAINTLAIASVLFEHFGHLSWICIKSIFYTAHIYPVQAEIFLPMFSQTIAIGMSPMEH